MGARFCLVSTRAVGVFSEDAAVSHAADVSIASQGRNTRRLGMARSMASCSMGSWVGPSSPTPMLSWVSTKVSGTPIRAESLAMGFT